MKVSLRVLVAVGLTLAAFVAEAKAQPFGMSAITQLSAGNGSITAQGSYNIVGGWATTGNTALYCYMQANPQNQQVGGLSYSVKVAAAPTCNKWGPLTIPNLPAGPYLVVLVMKITMGCGACQKRDGFSSGVASVTVTVPARGAVVPAGTASWAGGVPRPLQSASRGAEATE